MKATCDDTCCVCGAGGDDGSRVVDFLERKLRRGPVWMCARCFRESPLDKGWRAHVKRTAPLRAGAVGASA